MSDSDNTDDTLMNFLGLLQSLLIKNERQLRFVKGSIGGIFIVVVVRSTSTSTISILILGGLGVLL